MTDEDRNILLQVSRQTAQMVEAVGGLRRDMAELKRDVSSLKEDVARLKADVTGLKTDVAALKADVAALRTDVAALKADVAALQTDVAALKADVTELKEAAGRLEARMTTAENALEELRGEFREHRRSYTSWLESVSRELELVDHRARREARSEAEQRVVLVEERLDRLAGRVALLEQQRAAGPTAPSS